MVVAVLGEENNTRVAYVLRACLSGCGLHGLHGIIHNYIPMKW